MKKLILERNPYISYSIVYSPIVIGLLWIILEAIIFGRVRIYPFPPILFFYPFLFLLFQITWMEIASKQLLKKGRTSSYLKFNKMMRLFKISKWTFIVLTIQNVISWWIMQASIISKDEIPIFIRYSFIVFESILMIFMLISFYTFSSGRNFLGKLLLDVESNFDEAFIGNPKIHLHSVIGILSPLQYKKTHNRIKKILVK